jgi:hypothetical protein
MTDVLTIRPVIGGEPTDSKDRVDLIGVHGRRLVDLHVAPPLLAQVALRRIRESADGVPPDPDIFVRAAEIFRNGTVDGETPDEYMTRFSLAAGVPWYATEAGVDGLTRLVANVAGSNRVDLPEPSVVPGFVTRWVPSGRVFALVVTLGGHPGPHGTWVRALSLGYSVLVRPGQRDPFTPRRLRGALLAAGLSTEKIALLPGEDRTGQVLLEQADRAAVFGSPEVVRPWERSRHVKVYGPGRSKLLIDHEPTEQDMAYLVDAVADQGGVRCDNASVILTSGDPVALADALAERLVRTPAVPVSDRSSRLPAVSADRAALTRKHFEELSAGLVDHTGPHYGGDPLVALDDGSYAVRPVVLSAPSSEHPVVGTELVTPFVVVAPWRPEQGIGPLRESLVAMILADQRLVDLASAEPSIGKVVTGHQPPWSVHPSVPGDGLALTLAERKTVVTGGEPR